MNALLAVGICLRPIFVLLVLTILIVIYVFCSLPKLYIHSSSQGQFIMETYIVMLLSILFASYTVSIVTSEKSGDGVNRHTVYTSCLQEWLFLPLAYHILKSYVAKLSRMTDVISSSVGRFLLTFDA